MKKKETLSVKIASYFCAVGCGRTECVAKILNILDVACLAKLVAKLGAMTGRRMNRATMFHAMRVKE